MSENPYQSPQSDPRDTQRALGILSGSREDLKKVAKYQKGILVCILIELILAGARFAVAPDSPLLIAGGLVWIVAAIASTVFVFLLAVQVYSTGVGVLLGILTLIPCIGLIVLLIINGKATNILRQNGIHVGLLGANLSQV